ncbi:MAG: tetratricopeptide repeat protein [Burkholderiales bacterium]|nr:tetratricopeptide repeat protein [Burkholderiales bacterium]
MGLLDRIRGRRAPEREAPSRAGIALAYTHFEQGRADAAGAICAAILAEAPDDAAALHLLGLVAGQKGDAARAIDLIGQATRLDPAEGLYQLNLANALRVAGRTDDALAHYVRAAELSPERCAAWLNLGQLRAERGEAKEAIAALRRALDIDPDSGTARLALASVLHDDAKRGPDGATASAEAVSLLEAAWHDTPEPSRARFLLAKALATGSRWTEAVSHLEALAAAHPEIPELRNALANGYSRLGRSVEAIREYRESTRIGRDHSRLFARFAVAFWFVDSSLEDSS